jgi:hypothetical protein
LAWAAPTGASASKQIKRQTDPFAMMISPPNP